MGGLFAARVGRIDRGAPRAAGQGPLLSGGSRYEELFRTHWWAAVAGVTRLVGYLELAEDAVQDACAAALVQWPAVGVPVNPGAWLVGTARHKALDRLRRESERSDKEAATMRELGKPVDSVDRGPTRDDELSL